jgi:hypothetical protein
MFNHLSVLIIFFLVSGSNYRKIVKEDVSIESCVLGHKLSS